MGELTATDVDVKVLVMYSSSKISLFLYVTDCFLIVKNFSKLMCLFCLSSVINFLYVSQKEAVILHTS